MYCGRFNNHSKNDKMCRECKSHYEITLMKLKNNKTMEGVLKRLADR